MNGVSSNQIAEIIAQQDDYGHEMRVGGVLRGVRGATVQHGGTYTDDLTGKPRQFDYRYWISSESCRLALAVECKNIAHDTPLVISSAARTPNEGFHDLVESRQGRFEDPGRVQVGLSSVTRRVIPDRFYPADDFVGKSLLRVQTDKRNVSRQGESEIYERWAQALSSAVELSGSARVVAKHLSARSILTAILPMVVVPNDTLWIASYKDSGELQSPPKIIDNATHFVAREIEIAGPRGEPWYQTFTFSHVHFATLKGLSALLEELQPSGSRWGDLFVNNRETVKVSAAYSRDPANPVNT